MQASGQKIGRRRTDGLGELRVKEREGQRELGTHSTVDDAYESERRRERDPCHCCLKLAHFELFDNSLRAQ